MKRLAALVLAGVFAASAVLSDERNPIVVELFTSQGCSSCPPADALLHRLTDRSDVLPLALHVDYWDYIGWKDAFARPQHTDRQKAYAHVAGRNMVYTPQMVIMGQDAIVGADAMELSEVIAKHQAQVPLVSVTAARSGRDLNVTLRSLSAAAPSGMVVQLVRYAPSKQVDITRGELAGHSFTYANVVTDWQVLGRWDGAADLSLSVPLSGPDAAAVLVQKAPFGAIAAAVRVE